MGKVLSPLVKGIILMVAGDLISTYSIALINVLRRKLGDKNAMEVLNNVRAITSPKVSSIFRSRQAGSRRV